MSQAGIINTVSGAVPPTVATSYVTDNGTAFPALNILNVNGGVGVVTSAPGSSNQIVITVKNEGFTWSEQNASFPAAVQNGYFCNATLTATLPATAGLVIGNTLIIYVDTTQVVTIQANTGQMIQVGNNISAPGGTATSTLNVKGEILELIFKPSDVTWHTQSSMGSWSVV